MGTPLSPRLYGTNQLSYHHSTASTVTEPIIHPIFESATGTFQYIVADHASKASIIIDPVLDFDPCSSSINTASADKILSQIVEKGYNVHYILETHAHADHLSAASYLQAQLSKTQTKPLIGIGHRITQVQELFSKRYAVAPSEYNLAFDRLLSDNETLFAGPLQIKALHLPGHTPDHMGYQIGSNIFCGDSLFHVDVGTARTDFPGGSALALWESSQKLLALPEETRVWVGHDYPPAGREGPVPCRTVRQHREENKHVMVGRSMEEFVEMRRQRDAVLGAPRLLHQSLQVNVRGGRLPEADEGGQRMLRVPLKLDDAKAW